MGRGPYPGGGSSVDRAVALLAAAGLRSLLCAFWKSGAGWVCSGGGRAIGGDESELATGETGRAQNEHARGIRRGIAGPVCHRLPYGDGRVRVFPWPTKANQPRLHARSTALLQAPVHARAGVCERCGPVYIVPGWNAAMPSSIPTARPVPLYHHPPSHNLSLSSSPWPSPSLPPSLPASRLSPRPSTTPPTPTPCRPPKVRSHRRVYVPNTSSRDLYLCQASHAPRHYGPR